VWGVELLAGVEFPWDIKPIVRSHHERCDGAGYPERLKAAEIPIGAHVVGILDTYDNLVTGRCGAAAVESREAVWRIVDQREGWPARVVDAFVRTVS
ncbi:MAG TPA: HD domain-containing phosphohydrolase, partial [Gemmatimonadaceae bacterium]